MGSYKDLIADLSERLGIEIYPDLNNVVVLKIEKSVKIHIEADDVEEFLILGAFIDELPPGKFRENILKNGLKANYLVNKNPAILSYLGRENILTLHRRYLIDSIDVEELITQIKAITERAQKWQASIESGHAAPDDEIPSKTDARGKSAFGF